MEPEEKKEGDRETIKSQREGEKEVSHLTICLLEKVPHTTSPNAHIHLLEFRPRGVEERNTSFTSDGSRQESFA
jgi:hypothetical protein